MTAPLTKPAATTTASTLPSRAKEWVMRGKNQPYLALAAALLALSVYLFASAPPPLAQDDAAQGLRAEQALQILNTENARIRSVYTKELVTEGSNRGLKFSEDWRRPDVFAGPLPALLLREMSNHLQEKNPKLSLYLGSDQPIVRENLFTGLQMQHFEAIKKSREPQFFYDPSLKRVTAMFPDFAAAKGCVSCHNDHTNSPKKDWKLDDVMGATTWAYSGQRVSTTAMLVMIDQLRESAILSYESYLAKVKKFDTNHRYTLGSRWPRDGNFLPDSIEFSRAIKEMNSVQTLEQLSKALKENASKDKEKGARS